LYQITLASQNLSCLQNFPQFARLLAAFAGVAIPAAVVNSGLKYMQKRIQIAFQRRLSHHLHQQYCSNRAYYAASTLGGLTNADQRITEDVEKFAYNISELYSYTFKVCLHHSSHVKTYWRLEPVKAFGRAPLCTSFSP